MCPGHTRRVRRGSSRVAHVGPCLERERERDAYLYVSMYVYKYVCICISIYICIRIQGTSELACAGEAKLPTQIQSEVGRALSTQILSEVHMSTKYYVSLLQTIVSFIGLFCKSDSQYTSTQDPVRILSGSVWRGRSQAIAQLICVETDPVRICVERAREKERIGEKEKNV